MKNQLKEYTVFGHTEVTVSVRVKAENADEAMKKAEEAYGGIIQYAGNGSMGLIGPADTDNEQTISADEEIIFDDFVEE